MTPQEISEDINVTVKSFGLNYVRQNPEECFVIPTLTFESMEKEELTNLLLEVKRINKNWELFYKALLSQTNMEEVDF